MSARHRKILLALLVLFALILIPFAVWEDRMNAWADQLLNGSRSKPAIAAVVVLLLAADVILPVPSSVVSTAGGYLLGFWFGLAGGFCGMTLGCVLGYVLGRFAGRGLLGRVISAEEMEQTEREFVKRGDVVLVASRAVPMLAEASVIMAGVLRRSFPRFLAMTCLANLGVSAVYAAVGGFSLSVNSFFLAFVGALVVPWVAMRLMRQRGAG